MNFAIQTEELEGDAAVISLTGEVDLYTAPELKQELVRRPWGPEQHGW